MSTKRELVIILKDGFMPIAVDESNIPKMHDDVRRAAQVGNWLEFSSAGWERYAVKGSEITGWYFREAVTLAREQVDAVKRLADAAEKGSEEGEEWRK